MVRAKISARISAILAGSAYRERSCTAVSDKGSVLFGTKSIDLGQLRSVVLRIFNWLTHDRAAIRILILLVGISVVFIGIHLLRGATIHFGIEMARLQDPRLHIGQERGFSEIFNYLQISFLIAVLTKTYLLTRQAIYASWAAVYLLILGDDMLGLHERGGAVQIAAVADLAHMLYLSQQDFGELLAWSILGLGTIVALLIGFGRSESDHRAIGVAFGLLFTVLVAFAVVVDMVHSVILNYGAPITAFLIGVVEDGGEMLTISITCAIAVAVYRHLRRVAA